MGSQHKYKYGRVRHAGCGPAFSWRGWWHAGCKGAWRGPRPPLRSAWPVGLVWGWASSAGDVRGFTPVKHRKYGYGASVRNNYHKSPPSQPTEVDSIHTVHSAAASIDLLPTRGRDQSCFFMQVELDSEDSLDGLFLKWISEQHRERAKSRLQQAAAGRNLAAGYLAVAPPTMSQGWQIVHMYPEGWTAYLEMFASIGRVLELA